MATDNNITPTDPKDPEQIRLLNMINLKQVILKRMETKELVERVPALEEDLEKALYEEQRFKHQNSGYLTSSPTSDCQEVKRIEAELMACSQGSNDRERKAWLARQRKENDELAAALDRQDSVGFELENHRIQVEMAKRRLDSVLAVMAIKTAQLKFLGK